MNSTTRLKMIKEAIRLANMVQRGRGELEDQVRRNKEDIDGILEGMARHTIPRRLLRKRPRVWADLRPQDKDRISNKMARKCLRRGLLPHSAKHDIKLLRAYCLMGFVDTPEEFSTQVEIHMRSQGSRYQMRHNGSDWTRLISRRTPKEGTPTTRLDKLRRDTVDSWRHLAATGYRNPISRLEFYPDIHPDDVEWYRHPVESNKESHAYIVICSRQIIKLSKLFRGQALAANLYLSDEATASEVYYAAFLDLPRKAAPSITRAFIGIAYLPRVKDPVPTALYKTPAGALKAANTIYGHHMASLLYKDAAQ